MPRILYLENLSHQVNETELASLFADYGIQKVRLFDQLATAAPNAAGLVEVDTDEHGEQAIGAMNGRELRGHRLSIGWASREIGGADASRMFESMNVPEEMEGHSVPEPRGPRAGDFGDRSVSRD